MGSTAETWKSDLLRYTTANGSDLTAPAPFHAGRLYPFMTLADTAELVRRWERLAAAGIVAVAAKHETVVDSVGRSVARFRDWAAGYAPEELDPVTGHIYPDDSIAVWEATNQIAIALASFELSASAWSDAADAGANPLSAWDWSDGGPYRPVVAPLMDLGGAVKYAALAILALAIIGAGD